MVEIYLRRFIKIPNNLKNNVMKALKLEDAKLLSIVSLQSHTAYLVAVIDNDNNIRYGKFNYIKRYKKFKFVNIERTYDLENCLLRVKFRKKHLSEELYNLIERNYW